MVKIEQDHSPINLGSTDGLIAFQAKCARSEKVWAAQRPSVSRANRDLHELTRLCKTDRVRHVADDKFFKDD